MKIFLLFVFVLFISRVEQRRHEDDEDFKLSDILDDAFERPKHHSNKEYMPPYDDDDDLPLSFQREKKYPSRKKVLDDQQFDDPNEQPLHSSHRNHKNNRSMATTTTTTTTTTTQDYLSEASLCINEYDIKSEQLVKVKELRNGAHMIRFVMIGESSSTHGLNTKDVCMLHCCVEKNCDLAMLSEQRSNEGYKCYLFACNGSCTFASHRDYVTMTLKKDLSSVSTTSKDKSSDATSSTLSYGKAAIYSSHSASFLRESGVILVLLIGILFTMFLLVLVGFYCRDSWKRGRTLKNRSTDADYLINGLYL